MTGIPDNARRENHFTILFDPTGEEVQISTVRQENKELKNEIKDIKSKLDLLLSTRGI